MQQGKPPQGPNTPNTEPAASGESPGERFGRYMLQKELSCGGMGRVYRAVLHGDAPGVRKVVAIKRLLHDLCDDPEFITRFADEARIACSLNHTNIVGVFDFGSVEDEHFLAMEFVDGVDLATLLEHRRAIGENLPLPAALYIAASFCRGLGAAHQRRNEHGKIQPVVHRDVSPQNVLISRDGTAKITDFGIALACEKALRTRSGMVVGKCRYLSPEQALGKPIDPRADVFCAAAVLFETITGKPLFNGDQAKAIMQAIAVGPLPERCGLPASAPSKLVAIMERALSRDPAKRQAHGGILARELEHVLRTVAPQFNQDDLAAFVERALTDGKRHGDAEARKHAHAPTLAKSDSLQQTQPGRPQQQKSGPLADSAPLAESAVLAESDLIVDSARLALAPTQATPIEPNAPAEQLENIETKIGAPDGRPEFMQTARDTLIKQPSFTQTARKTMREQPADSPLPPDKQKTFILPENTVPTQRRHLQFWGSVTIIALCGLAAGFAIGFLGGFGSSAAAAGAPVLLDKGTRTATHDDWTVRLTEPPRLAGNNDAPRIVFMLSLTDKQGPVPNAAARLTLRHQDGTNGASDNEFIRPRFWQKRDGDTWLVCFDATNGTDGWILQINRGPKLSPLKIALPAATQKQPVSPKKPKSL